MLEKLINRASVWHGNVYKYIKCFKSSSRDKSVPDLDESSARTLLYIAHVQPDSSSYVKPVTWEQGNVQLLLPYDYVDQYFCPTSWLKSQQIKPYFWLYETYNTLTSEPCQFWFFCQFSAASWEAFIWDYYLSVSQRLRELLLTAWGKEQENFDWEIN